MRLVILSTIPQADYPVSMRFKADPKYYSNPLRLDTVGSILRPYKIVRSRLFVRLITNSLVARVTHLVWSWLGSGFTHTRVQSPRSKLPHLEPPCVAPHLSQSTRIAWASACYIVDFHDLGKSTVYTEVFTRPPWWSSYPGLDRFDQTGDTWSSNHGSFCTHGRLKSKLSPTLLSPTPFRSSLTSNIQPALISYLSQ